MTMPAADSPDTGSSSAIRILIVEDHVPTGRAVTALLGGTLGRHGDGRLALAVTTVRDAESALDSITAAPPDVVIMDISLPGMNGIEAARRLRHLAPAVPVIIHSRNDNDVYRAMAAEAGVRAFVSKRDTAKQLPASILGALGLRDAGQALISEPHSDRS